MQWDNNRGHGHVTVRPLDGRSEQALRDWLERARQAHVDIDDLASIEEAYDRYLAEVMRTPADRRRDPTPTLTTIAIAMGEHLRARSALQWRVAEDAEGVDLALVSGNEMGVLFPIDPVADAWSRQERRWLADFARGVLEQLRGAKS